MVSISDGVYEGDDFLEEEIQSSQHRSINKDMELGLF